MNTFVSGVMRNLLTLYFLSDLPHVMLYILFFSLLVQELYMFLTGDFVKMIPHFASASVISIFILLEITWIHALYSYAEYGRIHTHPWKMTLDAYQCDIKYYESLATLGQRIGEICRQPDRNQFKVTDTIPRKNYPLMQPNCRSSTICWFRRGKRKRSMRENARDDIRGYAHLIYDTMKIRDPWRLTSFLLQRPSGTW